MIFDIGTIDEAIFRTLNIRNRLLLEPMDRGGMRINEVLGLKPKDIDGRSFYSIHRKVVVKVGDMVGIKLCLQIRSSNRDC